MSTYNGILRSAPSMALVGCAMIGAASPVPAQHVLPRPSPLEPIGAISEMLASHRVVAIGNVEFRGNEQCQAFLRALVRDSRFRATGTDIVVEFGNARYQPLIDRFVGGEDVSYETFVRCGRTPPKLSGNGTCPFTRSSFAPCGQSMRLSRDSASCG